MPINMLEIGDNDAIASPITVLRALILSLFSFEVRSLSKFVLGKNFLLRVPWESYLSADNQSGSRHMEFIDSEADSLEMIREASEDSKSPRLWLSLATVIQRK